MVSCIICVEVIKGGVYMEKEHMKTYSISLYPTTHKLYMELKEKEGLTHDEAMKVLVKFYNNHKKLARGEER